MTTVFRASSPAAESAPQLGPLLELPGAWVGSGFNLIARPDKHDNKPFFLELNATRESLSFTEIGAPIPNRLITTLGYTYLSTRRRLAGDSTTGPLAFRPRHLLTLGADYTVGSLDVGADFRFASRPERIELEGFVDPRRVPVKVLDVRAGWSRGSVEFRLLVANALNYIYNLVPETLAPVRTVTLTAVWAH